MKKADIIRDLTDATKQRKYAADFVDLFGYSFSVVVEMAKSEKEVALLLQEYNDMLSYMEEKMYFDGLKDGRFQNILEKRLIKTGFIDISKIEVRAGIPDEVLENIKDFLNDTSEV